MKLISKKCLFYLLIICLFLFSCNKQSNSNSDYYPVDIENNNIVLHLNNVNSPYDNKQFTLYFFASDFNYRSYDFTFNFLVDIDNSTSIDIRVVNNNLILTNLGKPIQQSIISLEEINSDIFNENTKNEWIVEDLREEAIQHFSTYHGLTTWSTYLKSFSIINNNKDIHFDIYIRSQAYVQK